MVRPACQCAHGSGGEGRFMIDRRALIAAFQPDRELPPKPWGPDALVRFDLADEIFDLQVKGGEPVAITDPAGEPSLLIRAPRGFWQQALVAEPAPGFESLSVGGLHGAVAEADFHRLGAPYQGAIQRLFTVLRETVAGKPPRPGADPEPYRATDRGVGRYVFVRNGEREAR